MVDETPETEAHDADWEPVDAPGRRAELVAQIQSLETELSALQAELARLDDGVEEEEEPPADEDDSSRGNVGN